MTGCNAERSLTGFLVEPGTFTGKNELTLKKKKIIKERKKEKNWINISKIVWKKASQREEKKKKQNKALECAKSWRHRNKGDF